MVTFICLFFPPVLTVWAYEGLMRRELSRGRWFRLYVLDAVLMNLMCFFTKSVILKTGGHPLTAESGDMTPSAAMNYLIMAFVFGAVLVLAQAFCTKNVRFSVEDREDDGNA